MLLYLYAYTRCIDKAYYSTHCFDVNTKKAGNPARNHALYNSAEPAEKNSAEEGDAKVYTVGIVQQLEHPALDAATEGFQDKLTELLGDSVTFDYQNLCSRAICSSTGARSETPVTFRPGASFSSMTPAVLKSVTDVPMTGISEVAAAADCKAAEPNSVFQSELAQGYLSDAGLEFAEYTAADSNEVQAVITKAVSECDTVYIISEVAAAADCKAEVAFAIIRSTPSDTNFVAMVVQFVC